MAIQRWDPLRDLRELQQRMNSLFDQAVSRSTGADALESLTGGTGWKPATDLIEEGDRFLLRCDVPGVPAGAVEIKVDDGMLYLRGERKLDAGLPPEAFLRVERPYGPFAVRIALAPSVDVKRVRAHQRNGVIEVELPKKQVEAPSSVEVTVGEPSGV